MNAFINASVSGTRLVILSLLYIGCILVFRFQLALYWFKSAGKIISGFEEISKISWIIAGSGLLLSALVAMVGILVIRLEENHHWLRVVEHRLFYGALYFLLAWLGLLARTLIFDFRPLDPIAVIGASIFSVLVSLTVKFRAADAKNQAGKLQ